MPSDAGRHNVGRYIVTALLYISVVLIAVTGPLIVSNLILVFVEILAIWLIFLVFCTNKIIKFELNPKYGKKSRLIAKGPYKFIRYPLYTALLVLTLSLVIGYFDILRVIFWLVQLVATILKIRSDEVLLSKAFGDFSLYRQRTYRLIPFIF